MTAVGDRVLLLLLPLLGKEAGEHRIRVAAPASRPNLVLLVHRCISRRQIAMLNPSLQQGWSQHMQPRTSIGGEGSSMLGGYDYCAVAKGAMDVLTADSTGLVNARLLMTGEQRTRASLEASTVSLERRIFNAG